MNFIKLVPLAAILISAAAFAGDGSDVPACKGVTDACMKANVTSKDPKSGETKKGYQPGLHTATEKHGLWVDCVSPLANGNTVDGVKGVSVSAAKACLDAEHVAHPQKRR